MVFNNLEICSGKLIVSPTSKTVIQSDAFKKGCGAYCQKVLIGGQWSLQESSLHINVLELLAIKLALLMFSKMFNLKSIHFQVNNMSALSYLMKIGGTQNKEMIAISKEIWEFALSKEIMLTAEYLPGRLNARADWASRNFQDSSEWLLSPRAFQKICVKWGFPELDLFATRADTILHVVESRSTQPSNRCIPTTLEHRGLLYAFPPFPMIGKVLLKVKTEKVDVILITLSWPAQPWYSQVLELSLTEPLLLPQLSNILVNPQGQAYTLVVNKTLRLVAWKVSGRTWPRKEFRQGLQSLSQVPEDQAHHLITNRPGVNGLAGVVNGKLIRIHAI